MPICFEQIISETAKIRVWHITEDESFFLEKVTLQKNISHPHKRLQHLAGRYLLAHLFPDFPHELIEIADTRKPFLPGEMYHFSISHCGNYAAAFVSRNERVGIDIEIITPKVELIKNKFLNEEELQNQSYLTLSMPYHHWLTLLWSCKEAIFKWYGEGTVDFREHLHIISVDKETVQVKLLKGQPQHLTIQYKFFDSMVLAWVRS